MEAINAWLFNVALPAALLLLAFSVPTYVLLFVRRR